ncbi:MAG: hypothetical protein ABSH36_19095 [Solirubrobacteraceae bacterium]
MKTDRRKTGEFQRFCKQPASARAVPKLQCRLGKPKERERLPTGGTRQPAQRDRLTQLCFGALQLAGKQLDLTQQRGCECLSAPRP